MEKLIVNGKTYGPIKRFFFNMDELYIHVSLLVLSSIFSLSIVIPLKKYIYTTNTYSSYIDIGLMFLGVFLVWFIYELIVYKRFLPIKLKEFNNIYFDKDIINKYFVNKNQLIELTTELKNTNNIIEKTSGLDKDTINTISSELKYKRPFISLTLLKQPSKEMIIENTKNSYINYIDYSFKEKEKDIDKLGHQIFNENTDFNLYEEEELREIYLSFKTNFEEVDDFTKEVILSTSIRDIKNYLERMKEEKW